MKYMLLIFIHSQFGSPVIYTQQVPMQSLEYCMIALEVIKKELEVKLHPAEMKSYFCIKIGDI